MPKSGFLAKNNNILTVDVEDYFQVSAFEQVVEKHSWDSLVHRVEGNTQRVLDLFAEHNATATFFVLGWVAERYPKLIQRIVNEGHELASHGYGHQRLTLMSEHEVKRDIALSKDILEDISGTQVHGYRAPSFSINESNRWVFSYLQELGFTYSSSTFPIKHDLYGVPDWPRFIHKTAEGIWEIPMSTLKMANRNLPISGGGYCRLLPFKFSDIAIKKYLQAEQFPYMFYFHPWEIDAKQPRIKGATFKSNFRHYTNLQSMQDKIENLLKVYQWQSIQSVYQVQLNLHKQSDIQLLKQEHISG